MQSGIKTLFYLLSDVIFISYFRISVSIAPIVNVNLARSFERDVGVRLQMKRFLEDLQNRVELIDTCTDWIIYWHTICENGKISRQRCSFPFEKLSNTHVSVSFL